MVGNTLDSQAIGEENISRNSEHSWNAGNHLAGNNLRQHAQGQAAQPGSATASLRSRQSTQSGGSTGSVEGGWMHQQASGSDNISSITSTTVGSVSTASGGAGSLGAGLNGDAPANATNMEGNIFYYTIGILCKTYKLVLLHL